MSVSANGPRALTLPPPHCHTSLSLSASPCEEHVPITRSNLLLRSCVLRNTTAVIGLVVYAGEWSWSRKAVPGKAPL